MGINKVMEGAILTIGFVFLFAIVVAHFNTLYDQDNSIGLDTSALNDFTGQIQTGYEQTGGEATQVSDGLSLSTSWALAKGLFGVTWSFISGNWIPTIVVGMLKFDGTAGYTIARILQVLFLAVLLFSVIKLFFKTSDV